MAILSFSTASGIILQYDDATSEFIINPEGDSLELIAIGYNNTRKTIAQLSADHDGVRVFSGRSDYSGDAKAFPFIVVKDSAVITMPDELKDYVDRDVEIVYKGSSSYGKDQMTDNGDGTHYIDVPYSVYDGMVYQKDLTERWYFPSIGPFDTTYPQSITYNDINGRSDTYNTNITYTLINLPKILELDGVDVSTGQVPLLNTGTATMPVKWLNGLGVEQNDTEVVTPHNNATFVNVTRETTAISTYNHKTGLPVPALLYYKNDAGTSVDFNGTYEIPDTVVNQPITLGWSITNGDIPEEIEQAEFTQTLTVDEYNDVIMPEFTDNWGNSATLASRTQSVAYGTVAGDPTLYIDAPLNDVTLGSDLTGNFPDGFETEWGTPVYTTDGVTLATDANLVLNNTIAELLQYDAELSYLVKMKTATPNSFFAIGNHCTDVHDGVYFSSSSGLRTWYRNTSDTVGGSDTGIWVTFGFVQRFVSVGVYEMDLYINGVFVKTITRGATSNTTNHFRINGQADQPASSADVVGSTVVGQRGVCSYKDFKYYTRALSASDNLAYHNGDPIPAT